MKKKIVFVNDALFYGGVEKSLINLVNVVDKAKYEVEINIFSEELDLRGFIDSNVKVVVIHPNSEDIDYKFRMIYRAHQALLMCKRRNILNKIVFRLLYKIERFLWKKFLFYYYLQRKYDVAIGYKQGIMSHISTTFIQADRHVVFYHQGQIERFDKDKKYYKKADAIVGVSEGVCELLKKEFPQFSYKIVALGNYIDAKGIIELAKEKIFVQFKEKNSFIFVTVGRLSSEKGFELAIAVAKKLCEDYNLRFKWIFVGDGPERPKLEYIVKELNITDSILFVGGQDNPYKYMQISDVYIQPSVFESYSITIAEAMILEKKIVSTDTIGARYLLKEYMSGILCQHTVNDMCEKIIAMLHMTPGEKNGGYILRQKNDELLEKIYKMLEGRINE